MPSFAVVGATSWGLTLAWLLRRNQHSVRVVVRNAGEATQLEQTRALARLPALILDSGVSFVVQPSQGERLILAVPAQSMRETVERLDVSAQHVLSAAKGLEELTHLRMSEVLRERWPGAAVSVLSGPNLSHEIVAGQPAAAVIAGHDEYEASAWQTALTGGTFRCYRSLDVIGVELAGALKNVIAIAAGIGWGLEVGTNAVAALMTRGLAEMTRLGTAAGAKPITFQGLAGVGDLSATCFSPLSRNRRFGTLLGQGLPVRQALDSIGEAVEGMATAAAACELAKELSVEAPICAAVRDVLNQSVSVGEAVARLLSRDPRAE